MEAAHLLQRIGIKKNPTEFNNLRGILSHVYAMFVAGGRNMDHDIAIDAERGHLLGGHVGGGSGGVVFSATGKGEMVSELRIVSSEETRTERSCRTQLLAVQDDEVGLRYLTARGDRDARRDAPECGGDEQKQNLLTRSRGQC